MIRFMPVLAEISDKEPTITGLWCIAAFLCVGGFFLCRWRSSAGVGVLALAALWAWGMFSEIHSPNVGPAILEELGRDYVTQAYVAALIPFVVVPIGFWRRRHDVT